MIHLIWVVAIGGAIGALGRHTLNVFFSNRDAESGRVHRGILMANVIGSAVAGFASTAIGAALGTEWATVVLVGFCGGLTTFSALSVSTVTLIIEGHRRAAAATLALNFGGGALALLAGILLGILTL